MLLRKFNHHSRLVQTEHVKEMGGVEIGNLFGAVLLETLGVMRCVLLSSWGLFL